jgi:membrane protein implicated in regulation of membrane protease activity
MGPLIRYTLLQVPAWLLLGYLLWWADSKDWIGFGTSALIMSAWVVKDAALYPLCRKAFEKGPKTETEKLIGREAETVKSLAPEGLVRIDGELWTARAHGDEAVSAGTRIRVTGTDGLILIVEPAT